MGRFLPDVRQKVRVTYNFGNQWIRKEGREIYDSEAAQVGSDMPTVRTNRCKSGHGGVLSTSTTGDFHQPMTGNGKGQSEYRSRQQSLLQCDRSVSVCCD